MNCNLVNNLSLTDNDFEISNVILDVQWLFYR